MKKFILRSATLLVALFFVYNVGLAQRVIKGIVFIEGEPASGITVEAHKSSDSFFTSFDGKYEIKVSDKSKYIKFTFLDETKKLDIEGKTETTFNFPFDGVEPKVSVGADGVSLQSHAELTSVDEYIRNASLYDQFLRQKDYKSAVGHWRVVFNKFPKSSKNIYLHGVKIYRGLLDEAKSEKVKRLYLDSVMMVYDQRIKYFEEKGKVLGKEFYTYSDITKGLERTEEEKLTMLKKAFEIGGESIKLLGSKTEGRNFVLYFRDAAILYRADAIGKDKVLEIYDYLVGLLDKAISEQTDAEKITAYKNIKISIDDLFQKTGAADCESLVRIYTPKFASISNDAEALKKMLRLLDRQRCDDSELYVKGSEQLYNIEPSAEAAYNMAKMFYTNDDKVKASDYYEKAINAETDATMKSRYIYEKALILLQEKKFQKSREYARKAIKLNKKNGKAYELIGLIYVQASRSFSKDPFECSTLFWLAVDYFKKAKAADPSLAAACNAKIKQYKPYFPKKEDAFMLGLTDGKTHTVKGWVNETTSVRTSK